MSSILSILMMNSVEYGTLRSASYIVALNIFIDRMRNESNDIKVQCNNLIPDFLPYHYYLPHEDPYKITYGVIVHPYKTLIKINYPFFYGLHILHEFDDIMKYSIKTSTGIINIYPGILPLIEGKNPKYILKLISNIGNIKRASHEEILFEHEDVIYGIKAYLINNSINNVEIDIRSLDGTIKYHYL